MQDNICAHCKTEFQARKADRDRGWARFCSKSCKAKHQGSAALRLAMTRSKETDHEAGMDCMEAGWDGHKNAF